MSWVAAGIASGAATQAGVTYLHNRQQAKKDAANAPKYQIPDEVTKNLTDAQNYAAQTALEGLPEEQKAQYISNLQRSSAYGMNQLSNRRSGLTGIAALNENQNQGYLNLLSQDSAARRQNQRYGMGIVSEARGNVANYKDMQWVNNVKNPYYENIARRNANEGQLEQNLYRAGSMVGGEGGMGGMSGGGGQTKSMQQQPIAPQYQTYPMSKYQMSQHELTSTPYQGDISSGEQFIPNTGYNSGSNYNWGM